MDIIALLGISVGLAMDAFAVSISNGAAFRRAGVWDALKMALFFGVFQAVMPTIGWIAKVSSSVDHWIAFILLGFIGGKMIWEAVKSHKEETETEEKERFVSTKTLFLLAVATSIDALATGIILPSAVGASTWGLMAVSVGAIGIITLIISFCGVYIGKKFGEVLKNKAEILGGIVLLLIGIKILAEHLAAG